MSSIPTVDELRERRLTPIEIVRATWAIGRDRLGVILTITLVAAAVSWGVGLALRKWSLAWKPPIGYLVTSFLGAGFEVWWDGLQWMFIGLVVMAASMRASSAWRDIWRRTGPAMWKWALLIPIMIIVEGAGAILWMALSALMNVAEAPRAFWMPTSWLFGSKPYDALQWLVGVAIQALLAYVAFAPLALVTEGAGLGSALVVSWRRVLGNWRWVCTTAVVLWIPRGILRLAARPLHRSGARDGLVYLFASLADTFLLVGMALAYLNLVQRARPVSEPAPDPRLWDSEIRALGDRWPKV